MQLGIAALNLADTLAQRHLHLFFYINFPNSQRSSIFHP